MRIKNQAPALRDDCVSFPAFTVTGLRRVQSSQAILETGVAAERNEMAREPSGEVCRIIRESTTEATPTSPPKTTTDLWTRCPETTKLKRFATLNDGPDVVRLTVALPWGRSALAGSSFSGNLHRLSQRPRGREIMIRRHHLLGCGIAEPHHSFRGVLDTNEVSVPFTRRSFYTTTNCPL